jgi:membrane protein CcdC involved in cytochrome C biogenesis
MLRRVRISIAAVKSKYCIFWVCVRSLSSQHSIHIHRIIICGLYVSTTFFHSISETARFSKHKVTEHKMCVLIVSTTFVWNISHSKNWARYDQKCTGLRVKYLLFCQILIKTEFSRHISEKHSNINISRRSVRWETSSFMRIRAWWRRVIFPSLANASKKNAQEPRTNRSLDVNNKSQHASRGTVMRQLQANHIRSASLHSSAFLL